MVCGERMEGHYAHGRVKGEEGAVEPPVGRSFDEGTVIVVSFR